jgi:hypothetical protein
MRVQHVGQATDIQCIYTIFLQSFQQVTTQCLLGMVAATGALTVQPVWEREIGDRKTPPISAETGVLVGDGTDIAIYNHTDGERLASIGVSLGQIRALAIDDGTAFVLAESGLSGVSVPDGSAQWALSEEESSDYAQAVCSTSSGSSNR